MKFSEVAVLNSDVSPEDATWATCEYTGNSMAKGSLYDVQKLVEKIDICKSFKYKTLILNVNEWDT